MNSTYRLTFCDMDDRIIFVKHNCYLGHFITPPIRNVDDGIRSSGLDAGLSKAMPGLGSMQSATCKNGRNAAYPFTNTPSSCSTDAQYVFSPLKFASGLESRYVVTISVIICGFTSDNACDIGSPSFEC